MTHNSTPIDTTVAHPARRYNDWLGGASRDLLPQRGAPSDAAVRAGVLPSADGSCRTAAAVVALITNTGRTPADEEHALDGLHAYAGVQAGRCCAIAHAELRDLGMPAESHDGSWPAILTAVVVSDALPSACSRDDLCASPLDVHAPLVERSAGLAPRIVGQFATACPAQGASAAVCDAAASTSSVWQAS